MNNQGNLEKGISEVVCLSPLDILKEYGTPSEKIYFGMNSQWSDIDWNNANWAKWGNYSKFSNVSQY